VAYTSATIVFFGTSRETVRSKDDPRIKSLDGFLQYLGDWEKGTSTPKNFISDKL